mmetsp:Transcript_13607/g.36526  ORF Transcript_13607/g.36526 Transcript_13607/m.36526 type:complete len:694 (+) Transcript_13607:64-2145(+)|eukprot:CAMPEP_0185830814 /NCGR_PEP_ID=MMETSP1353-20130828/1099_1 /TAXON_ID=1077150 /ORGANISM="Erythrolobus australicus, Strain CCMP3124" /LENGTH=693 /DNA_ID=CAMNT_0028528799 /DNA_START=45 /DNA_END=2126 /DNA_ORIENTATION=+
MADESAAMSRESSRGAANSVTSDAESGIMQLSQQRLRKTALDIRKEHDHQLASMTHAQFAQLLDRDGGKADDHAALPSASIEGERGRAAAAEPVRVELSFARRGSVSYDRPPAPPSSKSLVLGHSSADRSQLLDVSAAAHSADATDWAPGSEPSGEGETQEQFYYTTTASDYDLELSMLFEELRAVLIREHESASREVEADVSGPRSSHQPQQQRRKPFETELVRQELRSWVSKLRALRAESESSVQLKSVRAQLLAREKELLALESTLSASEEILGDKQVEARAAEDVASGELRAVHNEFHTELEVLEKEHRETLEQLNDVLPREQAAMEKARAAEKELEQVALSQKHLERTIAVLRAELLHEHHERRRLRAEVDRAKHQREAREVELRVAQESVSELAVTAEKQISGSSSEAVLEKSLDFALNVDTKDRGSDRRARILELATALDTQQECLLENIAAQAAQDAATEPGGKVLLTKLGQPLGRLRRAMSSQGSRESTGSLKERRDSTTKAPRPASVSAGRATSSDKRGRAVVFEAAMDQIEQLHSENEVRRARLDEYDALVGELTDQLTSTYAKLQQAQTAIYETESQLQRAKADGARDSTGATRIAMQESDRGQPLSGNTENGELLSGMNPDSVISADKHSDDVWHTKLSGLFISAEQKACLPGVSKNSASQDCDVRPSDAESNPADPKQL